MGEGGFLPQGHEDGQVHNIQHWKDMTDSTLLITYTPGPGESTLHVMPGHTGIVPQKRVENQRLWELGLVVSRGQGVLRVP